jgi:hypothetical protein
MSLIVQERGRVEFPAYAVFFNVSPRWLARGRRSAGKAAPPLTPHVTTARDTAGGGTCPGLFFEGNRWKTSPPTTNTQIKLFFFCRVANMADGELAFEKRIRIIVRRFYRRRF